MGDDLNLNPAAVLRVARRGGWHLASVLRVKQQNRIE